MTGKDEMRFMTLNIHVEVIYDLIHVILMLLGSYCNFSLNKNLDNLCLLGCLRMKRGKPIHIGQNTTLWYYLRHALLLFK